jgi:hypothetical protein
MERPTALKLEDSIVNDSSLVVDRATAANMAVRDKSDQDGLPWRTFETWMGDLRNQPAWRTLADKCADYYDGNQLTAAQLSEMETTGMAPIVANIVRPTIDVVLGMEAKTRQDWRVQSDAGEFQDVAEAESFLLMEGERESKADRACSDAYAGQIKSGLGWVEVSRSMNPFEYPYRVRAVHRREIWWDWRAKEPDLSDARYLLRRRWVDLDELLAFFPDKADLIEQVGTGRITFNRFDLTTESHSEALVDAHSRELRTTIDDLEWRDTERRMLCLGEMWYRTWHRGHVIKIGGRIIPVDTSNPAIAAAIAYQKVKVKPAIYPKVRLAWWVGPHRLADTETPKKRFPYVPFWGFREDRTGIPYGLIRPMIDPQDEYNARRAKLMWLLSAKRVFADSDALDENYNTFSDLAKEVNRPDAVIVLNPDRRTNSGVKVDTDHGLATQQFQVMKDAQELLQQTAGVYQAMMGNNGNASSGYAINSLVEQGATTLAEINDNYRYSRRMVGEMLMELIVEDIGGEPYEISVGEGKRAKTIVLNQPQPDGSILNDVLRAGTKVTLADVPSTPSYRAQQLTMLGELTKSLPPQIQGTIIDFVIEATDLPKRREMAERIRKAMGVQDPEDMTPEQQQQAQATLAQQQQQQQTATQMQMREANATAAEKESRAMKTKAEADKIAVEVAQMQTAMAASGQTSPQVQQLQAQLQAIIGQAQAAQQATQQQLAQAQQAHEAELADLREALTSAQMAADNRRSESDGAVRIAEIERDARVIEANAEVEKARIEAKASEREAEIEQKFESQMKTLVDQIGGIRDEIAKAKGDTKAEAKEQALPSITIINERGSGNKSGVMKKQADGSYTMEVSEAKASE